MPNLTRGHLRKKTRIIQSLSNMALIAMAVHDTAANNRTRYTKATLECIADTVDLSAHRLFIINNDSCEATCELLSHYEYTHGISIIHNDINIGTAKAINKAWKHRHKGEHLIKMDNDVIIHYQGWVDEMELVMNRASLMPEPVGILGLKRKDLLESPSTAPPYNSTLIMLPHEPGQRWLSVEIVNHVMGTCQMYSPDLIDEIGGLYQMDGVYGFDDSLAAVRSTLAGYQNAFLNYIDIDHIDTGSDSYTEWKRQQAHQYMDKYNEVKMAMIAGTHPIHFPL